ncbi:CRISPR-associated endonuclease Cas9 [Corynebacterium kalinowskii]|uniref:CRISPR-associated endonuclease Cas9 n=1 Tax=Corynebacterium kalinowskii TaxID=2675216 RepID=A0A6B8W6G1_9CORY|nr:CRISPR-associated endonuclease Cas9 [Corynebacterium kalinowskii]
MERINYAVGIDVGTHSVGFAAIALDDNGAPTEILNLVSHIHDSGIDPDSNKKADTRLAVSGIARRTRRMFRRKKKRLQKLDKYLEGLGWPVKAFEVYSDPFLPWKVRAELAQGRIADASEMQEKLSIALRHIARHRGWRNPYSKVESLMARTEPSAQLIEIRTNISKAIGYPIPEDATVGQIVAASALGNARLRGEGGLLSARLMQSDHANELWTIFDAQGVDHEIARKLVSLVFSAESPKGSASGRVGKDPLQPHLPRALKASDAFQRYRIAALIGNLRIREGSAKAPLSIEQRRVVFDYLVNLAPKMEPEWINVAEILGIDRGSLLGTATITDDGERAGARPPVHDTNRSILSSKLKPLSSWWKTASDEDHRAMLKALSNSESFDFDTESGSSVQAFFESLEDSDHEKLDSLRLPLGRAAYSESTLERLTDRMLNDGIDLYEARKLEFDVPNDWAPPAPDIAEPVGNPAVDRVLKAVARWLNAAESEWGAPSVINIENVRSGFLSEAMSRQLDREMEKRGKRNLEIVSEMQARLGIEGRPRSADLWRFQSIQRQNGQCAYCGQPIDFKTCEMDHIVPRAGMGSTNTRENLLAVCKRCNHSKSNTPFVLWAEKSAIPGVSVAEALERLNHWLVDPGLTTRDFAQFKSRVAQRLKQRTFDEEFDARSIEPVAWMANELRARVQQKFGGSSANSADTTVNVYKGSLTAEARRASGISGNLRFADGVGKSRLDRRHHAIDAAVIAMMSRTVAEVLALRVNLKEAQRHRREAEQWKEFTGTSTNHQIRYNKWLSSMKRLGAMLQVYLEEDRIPVTHNLRLRLGNGAVHEDTVGKLTKKLVGDAMSIADIDKAASEALWCALTRCPDFDKKDGLPANPERTIRVGNRYLNADDEIEFFPVSAGAIAVRGGYVELGRSMHHARVYRVPSGKKTAFAMMRVYTADLARFRNDDLFSVEIPLQTMSVRQSEPKLRKALEDGTAEYLGWLVVDDEIQVDMATFNTGQIGAAQEQLGEITSWNLDGFFSNSRLRLRPRLFSAEGLKDDAVSDVRKVLDTTGWLPAINKVFGDGKAVVIRRDSLGRVRLESAAHLPVSWKA